MIIGLLNGPNLNLLGSREPSVYGTTTLAQIVTRCEEVARELDVGIRVFQSNGEGPLIDQIQAWRSEVAGVVVNAGAYTHTSLALRDAFGATNLPFVEVHLSNIYAREPERRHSVLASASIGMVCGLGAAGYEFALRGLVQALRAQR